VTYGSPSNTMFITVHIKNSAIQLITIIKCINLFFHCFIIIPYHKILSMYNNENKYKNFVSNSNGRYVNYVDLNVIGNLYS
jgi:hypothetical protein